MYFAMKISIGFVIIYKLYNKFAVDEVSGKVFCGLYERSGFAIAQLLNAYQTITECFQSS